MKCAHKAPDGTYWVTHTTQTTLYKRIPLNYCPDCGEPLKGAPHD